MILACAVSSILGQAGCSRRADSEADVFETLPRSLTALKLFEGKLERLAPTREVTQYEINTTSFHDFAASSFVMKLPRGLAIKYKSDEPFDFPVGTVLAQTLSYSPIQRGGAPRIVETRVLLRRSDRWIGLPYVWNEDQTDARLALGGARLAVSRMLPDGSVGQQLHIVPNFNDCKRCHRIGDIVTPIAVTARQLNLATFQSRAGNDQLADWAREGMLSGLPPSTRRPRLARWNDPATGEVDQRARAWLEANCAHCHNPRGMASNSGLQLAASIQVPSAYGVLKTPIAAGRGTGGLSFDILPGQPNQSILLHRVRSTEPGVVMPEFGRTQVDEAGVALLSEWIASMPAGFGAVDQSGLVGIVTDLSSDEAAAWVREALEHGSSDRGAQVLRRPELNCTKCHAVSGHGGDIGPDLSKIGPPFHPEHIVEAILLPSKTIKDGFRSITVETTSGLMLTGVQVQDDGREVVLRDPVRGETRIAKADVVTSAEAGSLMPAQVVATLKREEFLDLVRYLIELNQPSAAAESPTPAANPN